MHSFVCLLAAGLCAAVAASSANAQVRRVAPAPITAPSASARSAQAAPQPSGLQPVFPAGLTAGSGAAVSTDRVASTTAPAPEDSAGSGVTTTGGSTGVPAELPGDSTASIPATNVLGAGPSTPGPNQFGAGGAGGVSATDIARSFFFADANHDGELTRAEFRRLSVATLSFEQMDRNFDGVISRSEYEDSLR